MLVQGWKCVRDEVKCLGYVWRGNLSAVQVVECNCSNTVKNGVLHEHLLGCYI